MRFALLSVLSLAFASQSVEVASNSILSGNETFNPEFTSVIPFEPICGGPITGADYGGLMDIMFCRDTLRALLNQTMIVDITRIEFKFGPHLTMTTVSDAWQLYATYMDNKARDSFNPVPSHGDCNEAVQKAQHCSTFFTPCDLLATPTTTHGVTEDILTTPMCFETCRYFRQCNILLDCTSLPHFYTDDPDACASYDTAATPNKWNPQGAPSSSDSTLPVLAMLALFY